MTLEEAMREILSNMCYNPSTKWPGSRESYIEICCMTYTVHWDVILGEYRILEMEIAE
jgi:hypothetical protein